MNITRVKKLLINSALCTLFVITQLATVQADGIMYPWRASPAIVVQGDSFEMLYDNRQTTTIDSVRLEGDFHQVRLQAESIMEGEHEYDTFTKNSANYKITLRVPEGTPTDLYDLVIYHALGQNQSVKSVKVIDAYKKKHTFIHISDPHVSRQWVGTPENGYAKEIELLDRFVDIANIINPDFIIVTGDLIHDYTRHDADSIGWGGKLHTQANELPSVHEKFNNYYIGAAGFKGISGLTAPAFSIAGNHDFYGIKPENHPEVANQWNMLNGKRVYGMSYGDTRVLFMDDFLGDPQVDVPDHAPLSGLQGQVLKQYLQDKGMGKLRILAQHRHNRVDTAFSETNQINLILHGHNHTPHQEYFGSVPTLNSRPGSISRSGSVTEWEKVLGFFQVFTVEEDKLSFSAPLRIVDNPTAPYHELEPNLISYYQKPNDGSQKFNEVLITNKFTQAFDECAIRFVMKKGAYQIEGGEIKQIIDTDQCTVVDVIFDLGSEATKKLRLYAVEP